MIYLALLLVKYSGEDRLLRSDQKMWQTCKVNIIRWLYHTNQYAQMTRDAYKLENFISCIY